MLDCVWTTPLALNINDVQKLERQSISFKELTLDPYSLTMSNMALYLGALITSSGIR
jgi:hypothetical protein